MVDDIMDSSETRFGVPCWYRTEGIGMHAITDSLLLENTPYGILKNQFSNHTRYGTLLELFHKVNFKVSIGQATDIIASLNGKPQFDLFTTNVYQAMATNKCAFPFFVLPTILAWHFAKQDNKMFYSELKTILVKLGQYFQIQNDISDCYGDSEVTGKKGNDIRQGRNTWLIVTALENATADQQEIIKQHYGKPNFESEQNIREIFNSMYILEKFLQYKDETYHALCKEILKLPDESIHNYLLHLVKIVFGHKL
ncbi:hypothetical protein ILUMI_23889 [Ignelater luminosus]|uniref:Farnesyl diphosphate synthase n=1 Tax=Ignelater luminosus TaxID=2038154 RepID=A0A8K0G1H0_IGNLU|nr:hypothetical protein ILUMI_23889 [Ignelater luminosus]